MPVFRVSGATGQAPTTAWFGSALPDRGFTMARPAHWEDAGNLDAQDGHFAAPFISTWTPWDTGWRFGGSPGASITLGPSVTAPDGTSTANKIVETSTNSEHFMVAGFGGILISVGGGINRRFAIIAAAGERTRMVCSLTTNAGDTNGMGCRTVFDLAGGQIGVANTAFGSDGGDPSWIPGATSINFLGTLFGKTWYLCIMDVTLQRNTFFHNFFATIGTDSGSGTGAISNSYAGNGTSGLYVWKSSVLPPRAWGLSSVGFFDDFLSAATIDINNTRAAGFNWYLNNKWTLPGFSDPPNGPFPTIPASAISVTSSIMLNDGPSFLNGIPGGFESAVQSAASLGTPGTFVGWTFQPPCLIEFRSAGGINVPLNSLTGYSPYGVCLEALLNPNHDSTSLPVPTFPLPYSEIDFAEIASVDIQGGEQSLIQGDEGGGSFFSTVAVVTGYENWFSTRTYSSGAVIHFSGQLYTCIVALSTAGNQPNTHPLEWSVFTPPAGSPSLANSLLYDNSQQHTNSFIWLEDRSKYNIYDIGEVIPFYNNNHSGATNIYGSSISNASVGTFFQSDGRNYVIHLQCTRSCNSSWDFVRITK